MAAVSASEKTVRSNQRGAARQFLPTTLALVVGVAFSVAAFVMVDRKQKERFRRDFEWLTRNQTQALRVVLRESEECLYTLRNLVDSSEFVSAEEFQRTAADLRERHPWIESLQWLLHVPETERASFEERGRREVHPGFFVHDTPPREAAPDAPPPPAPSRKQYAPVLYVEPHQDSLALLGLDYFAGPHAAAMHRAVAHGTLVATRRFLLQHDTDHETGWGFYLPVMTTGPALGSPNLRVERLRGFVGGHFRLLQLVSQEYPDLPTDAVNLVLVDITPGEPEDFLVGYLNSEAHTDPLKFPTDLRHSDLEERIHIGGRVWAARYQPSAAWVAAQDHIYPFAFLFGGLVLTGLLTALLRLSQKRTMMVERVVQERTMELRKTQEQLREDIQQREESEERYRAFIEQSTEAIWRFELDRPLRTDLPEHEQIEHFFKHSFLAECNDTVAHMYGYKNASELVGRRLADLMPQNDPANIEHLRQYVRSGFRMANSESHEIDAQGQQRIILNNITGICEHGCLLRYWGTQRDITEQRRAEEERRHSETRLRIALEAADLGTWEWDLENDFVRWSETTERMFGLAPGTFDGRIQTYFDFVHPEDRPGTQERLKIAVGDGKNVSGQIRIIRADGETRWIFSRGDVVRNDRNQVVRVVGVAMDVTDQHLALEAKANIERRLQETQKLESLGILAGGVAHDFNNLLTGILGNASLARMDLPVDSPVQPCLEAIEATSQRAAELCKQMLAYSGKGRFVVQNLDLSALVEDTAHLVKLSIKPEATLKFSLVRNLPPVSADATQMGQIIMNLVINASDAFEEKGGVINLTTGVMHADHHYLNDTFFSPNLPEGDYVFLEVSDNGAGMSPETLKRIFEPFFTTKFTGRGLGLAAVLGIVRGHRGALKVYSELGKGTTFKLLLPRSEGFAEAAGKQSADATTWRGSGTILVVDDERAVRDVTQRMLEALGFTVVLAASGAEAVEFFRVERQRVAIVLLDLTMPQLDGSATFTELRRIEPTVRVLLMSGFNEQDAVTRFSGKGLAGFLQKPFKPQALRDKLRALLEVEVSTEL